MRPLLPGYSSFPSHLLLLTAARPRGGPGFFFSSSPETSSWSLAVVPFAPSHSLYHFSLQEDKEGS